MGWYETLVAGKYGNQVPLARAVPMWGGCSADGFSVITFHKSKKLHASEWEALVKRGGLVNAVKSLKPVQPGGPWHILCDNESFLRTAVCNAAHKAGNVKLWKMPAKCPDLNSIQRFWPWLRRKLRTMDLKDAVAKRAVLSKFAFKARVRAVCRSTQAQRVAGNQVKLMKRVCKEVASKKGAATSF